MTRLEMSSGSPPSAADENDQLNRDIDAYCKP
jgi:hypothetical protein